MSLAWDDVDFEKRILNIHNQIDDLKSKIIPIITAIDMGNNPMVGMTVAVAVAIEEAMK